MNKKGLALIAVIIIVLFVSLAVLGVTGFIANRFLGFDVQQRLMRCIYNAQAGIQYAIYQYRQSGTLYASGTTVAIDANNAFRITSSSSGTQASALVVNATASALTSSSRNLTGITLQNTSGSSITIDCMIVTWSGSTRTMQDIIINGVTVWNVGTSTTPANVDITNTAISASSTLPLTRVRWNSSMAGRTITLRFVMLDGSTTSLCTVFPRPASTCTTAGSSTLTITSMGTTTGSSLYDTVRATYNTTTGNISTYSDIPASVP
jgi:hypothetical protein